MTKAQLAVRLSAARKARGLTQAQAANFVGVCARTMKRWESPTDPSAPRITALTMLVDLYDLTLEKLAA